MIYKNNLSRIKGILSARQGAEIPKFQNPAGPLPTTQPFYTTSKLVNGVVVYQYWLDGKEVSQDQYLKDPRVVQSIDQNSNNITKSQTQNVASGLNDSTPPVTNPNGMYWENPYGTPIPNEIKVNTPTSAVIGNPAPQGDMMKARVGDMAIPGDPGLTPSTSIENSAVYNAAVADTRLAAQAKRQALDQIHEQYRSDKLQISQDDLNADLKARALADVKEAAVSGLSTESQAQMDANAKAYVKSFNDAQAKKLRKQEMTGQIAQVGTQVFTAIGDTLGAAQAADDSELTQGITTGYKAVQNAVSNLGPIGQAAGSIMGIASATGDILQSMGGGTDQQSTLDKWMDSPLLSWNVGAINGFFGKNTDSFGINYDAIESVGSSYVGAVSDLYDAQSKANKKYGLFSSKSRKEANEAIAKAKATQNLIADIGDVAADQRLAQMSMSDQLGLAYKNNINGGYNQKFTYAAKEGGLLNWHPADILEWQPNIDINEEIPRLEDGDALPLLQWSPNLQIDDPDEIVYPKEYLKFKESLPENQRNTPENKYRTYLYWQLWGKPKDFQYTLDHPDEDGKYMYQWDPSDEGYHANSVMYDKDGVGYFMKSKDHESVKYELDYYYNGTITEPGGAQRKPNAHEFEEWKAFRDNYVLEDDGDFYKYIPIKKDGGNLGQLDESDNEETSQKNVIPEGALHKNKHHMEHADGLTKKGIPVVDDEGNQQAEIEHSEIIFTLEVTKKLEEYYERFYDEDATASEKEQVALEAGKLLVYEILENTEDRTGLIDVCREGGSLTLKQSSTHTKENYNRQSKDIMKEALKEALLELLTR